MKTYTLDKEDFVGENREVLEVLYHDYLSNLKEDILEGSFEPMSFQTFATHLFKLKGTPSEIELLVEGILWEIPCQ